MKHKFLMVFILISVFILSALLGMLYSKNLMGPKVADAVGVTDADAVDAAEADAADTADADAPDKNVVTVTGDDTSDSGDDPDDEPNAAGSDHDPETADPAGPEGEKNSAEEDTGDGVGDTFDSDEAIAPAPLTGEIPAQMLPVLPKFDNLLQINPYVSGWLTIDGSPIDDPVVYTPGSQNYFLHRDINGSNTSKGTLFIAINWQNDFNNTLIYGHNMKDGTGFGALSRFADSSYGLTHSVIHFDTLYEERTYQLLGVFYSQIDEDELETEEDRAEKDMAIAQAGIARKEAEIEQAEGDNGETQEVHIEPADLTLFDIDLHRDFGSADIYRQEKDDDRGRFRYYYYTDLADRNDFEYYVRNVKERSLYDTGVDAEWGDELITLSTCSYQVRNGRFIVVGVRKK